MAGREYINSIFKYCINRNSVSVGWSITGIIAKLFMEPGGFGIFFDRDTFSLLLLTIGEYFFYRIYYKEKPPEDAAIIAGDKEKQ